MLTSREIYKIRNNHAPPIMHNLFQLRKNTYNLRNYIELVIQNKKISNYRLETVSYRVLFDDECRVGHHPMTSQVKQNAI